MRSRFTLLATFLATCAACAWYAARVEGQGAPGEIDKHKDFAKVQAVFQQYCFECHGKNAVKPKGKFNVSVLDHLKARALPEAAGQLSLVAERLTSKDPNSVMPPPDKPQPSAADRALLEGWLKDIATGGASAQPVKPVAATGPESKVLANEVKEIFRTHCIECHGDNAPKNGVKMLDHNLLVTQKKKVKPGKLVDSRVYQMIAAKDADQMPPADKPQMELEKVLKIVDWINAGAPAWDTDVTTVSDDDDFFKKNNVVGVGYVLQRIRDDIRQIPVEERRYVRYVSINHLLVKGVTDKELVLYRKALTKAINHLSWERDLVELRPVDVTNPGARPQAPVEPEVEGAVPKAQPYAKEPTVFAIDLRRLGWDRYYYDTYAYNGSQARNVGESKLNLYDLALLEYPYSTIYYNSRTYDEVFVEYLQYSGMVRPIPYVRGDWFCSICTQHPVYEDMMQLPMMLDDGKGYGLEPRLGVNAYNNLENGTAARAGMILSGVSRNNRIVERHPARFGHYWKSIDFQSSTGGENMFRNPIDPNFSGGEMIFNLPNGMQGYLVTDNKGNRINEAPTSIVVDKFATDKVVRNGLACIRCHDQGVKDFQDTVRPAVEKMQGRTLEFDPRDVFNIYPPHDREANGPRARHYMIDYLKKDKEVFANAYQKMLGETPPTTSPLTPVSQRFLDDALDLKKASAELGYRDNKRLEVIFTIPQFTAIGVLPLGTGGYLRRDAWEDYYDQVVSAVGVGDPIVNLDGLNRPNYQTNHAIKVKMVCVDHVTGKPKKTFVPGDKLFIDVVNEGPQAIYVELFGTSASGQKMMLAPNTTIVKGKSKYRYPTDGKPLVVKGGEGKEFITMYCCDERFPAGLVLKMKPKEYAESKWMFDRVVHPFYSMRRVSNKVGLYYDNKIFRPERIVKKTIAIETQ